MHNKKIRHDPSYLIFASQKLVTGVPLGTYIGQTFGWQSTFLIVAILGSIALIGSAILVPKNLKQAAQTKLIDQSKVLTEPCL